MEWDAAEYEVKLREVGSFIWVKVSMSVSMKASPKTVLSVGVGLQRVVLDTSKLLGFGNNLNGNEFLLPSLLLATFCDQHLSSTTILLKRYVSRSVIAY